MTTLTVLAALSMAFLVVTWFVEWTARRLGEPTPYEDPARGSSKTF